MDLATVRALIELNNDFYADNADSFSATRSAPWQGWDMALELLNRHGWAQGRETAPLVLDLACGNLRFERFLSGRLAGADPVFHAVDICPELAGDAQSLPHVSFHRVDVLQELMANACAPSTCLRDIPPCDLAVTFGFMHHVPDAGMRRAVLDLLIDRVVPGGVVIVSFWQFMSDGRLARKALAADEGAHEKALVDIGQLEPGDHFLGWQSDPSPLRYCHHFDEAEIDGLVASVGTSAREVARYSADGSSGTLNRYLVLERTA